MPANDLVVPERVVLLMVAVFAAGHIDAIKKLSRNNVREELTLADSLGR